MTLAWRQIMRHPRKLALFFGGLMLFFALQLPKLTAELRIYDIVDPKFKSTGQLRELKDEFGDENSVLLLFTTADGSPLLGAQACKIRDWLSRIQEGPSPLSKQISGVVNPFRLKRSVLSGQRVEFEPILPPFACDSAPFSARALVSSPWGGLVTDTAGRDLAAQVAFSDTQGGSRYGKFDPAPIGALWADMESELLARNPGIRAYLGGRSSFQWYYQKALKHDALINVAVLILLLLFFRLYYGTWKSGLILLGVIGTTALFIFGAMSLVGSPIDYLSNGLFLMMCIAAVEDFIFISHEQLTRAARTWRPSVRSLLLPGFFTSLTTLVGFLSLGTADLQIIRRFGFWAGWAALCEWGMIFIGLPILLKAWGVRKSWVEPARAGLGGLAIRISRYNPPRSALWISGALFAASVFGFFRLDINDSPRTNFVKSHMQRQAYEYLKTSRGWEGPVFVLFPNAYSEADNEAVLAELAQDPNVARIEDPYQIRSYFLRGFDEDYQRLIRSQLSLSKTYRNSFSRLDTARAALYLKSLNLADINQTIARVSAACATRGCFAAGEGVVYAEYSNRVVDTLFKSFASSLLLVGAIVTFLAFAMGAERKLGLLFSVFWSPVLIVGGLALFRVPLNLTTSMFASVLVGLTGDNAVQFLFASRGGNLQNGIHRRGGASVQVTTIAASASLLFLGLTLVPLKTLGLLLFLGFLISLAGDLWVLNGITRPRN